jgi:hypothetical protein
MGESTHSTCDDDGERWSPLQRWIEACSARMADLPDVDSDRGRLVLIEVLERLKSAAAAAQARLTEEFAASRLAAAEQTGADPAVARRSVIGQVALARHDSPVRGGGHLRLARALVEEMPHTWRALADGTISEWHATLVVRETACLSRDHRAAVDLELAGRMGGWGDRRVAQAARAAAYRLDPRAVVDRLARAANDRRVSIRPAPDTMAYLTGLLPVTQGAAAYTSLRRHADRCRAAGDPRTRGQIMADELIARVIGNGAVAAETAGGQGGLSASGGEHGAGGDLPRGVGVEIGLIMTDRSLFGTDDQAATLTGHGPIPAETARRLVNSADPGAVFIRRLYTDRCGRLIAMESRRRAFPAAARRFLIIRDQSCRTPWCDAPIRHADHITPAARGGPTAIANGRGLCENCNYLQAAPGWSARSSPGGVVHLSTPTGETHVTSPPALHPSIPELDIAYPNRLGVMLRYEAA